MAEELLVGVLGNLQQLQQLSDEVSMALAGTALLVIGTLLRRTA